MRVVSAGTLIRRSDTSDTFTFMRMFVDMFKQIVGGKRRDVERCRQGSDAMGICPPD